MGNVRLYGSTSGYTELAAPAVAPDGVLTLPAVAGTLATTADVDTAETDAIAAGGLVHINTTTFTTEASVSLDDVFSATYNNYKILATFVTSTNNLAVNLRYRVGGVDNSSAGIYLTRGGQDGAFGTILSDGNSFLICNGYPGGNYLSMDLLDPFASKYTQGGFDSMASLIAVAAGARFGSVIHGSSTSFDGFTIYPASGTITGTIRVYGYKNS